MNKLISIIFGSETLELVFDVPIDVAVERLRSEVSRTTLSRFTSQRMVGSVSEKRTYIHRVIPMVQNSFKPIFIGSFSEKNNKTILSGILRLHRFTQVFVAIWLGFIAIWTIVACIGAVAKPSEAWFFPLAGLFMFGVGLILLSLGQWFARNDKSWLENAINNAISKSS